MKNDSFNKEKHNFSTKPVIFTFFALSQSFFWNCQSVGNMHKLTVLTDFCSNYRHYEVKYAYGFLIAPYLVFSFNIIVGFGGFPTYLVV